jgi:hypothetical protein
MHRDLNFVITEILASNEFEIHVTDIMCQNFQLYNLRLLQYKIRLLQNTVFRLLQT